MPQLTLSRDEPLDAAASIALGPEALSSPRAVNKAIWRPEHALSDALSRALRDLVGSCSAGEARVTLRECGVDALDGAYVTAAVAALRSDVEHWRWLRLTRQLGGQTHEGLRSDLADVRDGPIRLLETADIQPPTLVVDASNLFELKSNQRAALLDYLTRLTPGVHVRIFGSRRVQRLLLDRHRDDLPASVIERAESRLAVGPTRTEQRREHVRDLLARRDPEHDDWRRLQVVADAPRERLPYDDLLAHPLIEMSRDALKQWASRMADHDLIERTGPRTVRAVALRPAGAALLAEHPTLSASAPDVSGGAGRTADTSQPGSTVAAAENAAVSDPPNDPDSPVYSPPAHDGPQDRSDDEAAPATEGGASHTSSREIGVDYLAGYEHDASVALADTGEIALCDRPVDSSGDSRVTEYSFLEERDELVVRVEASSWAALTMTRLCAALLNETALSQVLTRANLAGGPDRNGLAGLPVENPYVLRGGACFGWLKNEDATADRFIDRLVEARNDLLARTEDIDFSGDDPDTDAIAQLLRDAHGLAGTVTRVYDMLGIEVTRVIEFPAWTLEDSDRREHVAEMLATQTAVASRYGVYSANRILHEPRPEKREQTLGTPAVDDQKPTGDVVGSWVLVGDGVDELRNHLEDLDRYREIQEDGEHFAPFRLPLAVVDGDRREAYAETLARQCRLKDLDTTRSTVGLLQALTRDVFAAGKAVSRLGSEDNTRNLSLHDVRTALSYLDPAELVPDIGPHSVSAAVQVLLDVDERLSTSELADAIGVSTQTLRNNDDHFKDLEALGLLERVAGGVGEATTWRLRLPFKTERRSDDAPSPAFLASTLGSSIDMAYPADAVAEVCFEATHREIDYGSDAFLSATSPPLDTDLLVRTQPQLRPLVEVTLQLIGASEQREYPPKQDRSLAVDLGVDPSPQMTQACLEAPAD